MLPFSAIGARAAFLLAMAAPPLAAQGGAAHCLAAFAGHWRGEGTVLGRAIIMDQRWGADVGGAFRSLVMRHLVPGDTLRPQFEGRGFYRAADAAAPDSVRGVWLDARGVTMPVSGTCRNADFQSQWDATTERGKTVYRLDGDALIVIDSVFPAAGAAREFGRSRLQRIAPP